MNHSTPSYAPDDAKITVQSLEFLNSPPGTSLRDAAIALISHSPHPSVAAIAALRKVHPPEHLHAALTLAGLQAKAAGPSGKFPGLPFVWATPEALQQATHAAVARLKAQRFAALNPERIIDLCAGIGGDALALADVAPTTAIDLSPVRTTCLRLNAAHLTPPPRHPLDILTQDLRAALPQLPRSALFHIDPARRSAAKRSPRYADLIPGPDILEQVLLHFDGGAIKLSPAVDFDSLPQHGHLELISRQGTVVQALLWLGALAHLFPENTRTATLILDTPPLMPQESSLQTSFTAPPARAVVPETAAQFLTPTPPPYTRLYELDGTFTRASLAAPFAKEHNLLPLTPDGGYLLAIHPLENQKSKIENSLHPALTPFDLLAVIPYSEARVLKALSTHATSSSNPPKPIEVKSRGHLPGIDTDKLQVTWSKSTPVGLTVLLFPFQKDVLAAIARRPAPTRDTAAAAGRPALSPRQAGDAVGRRP